MVSGCEVQDLSPCLEEEERNKRKYKVNKSGISIMTTSGVILGCSVGDLINSTVVNGGINSV